MAEPTAQSATTVGAVRTPSTVTAILAGHPVTFRQLAVVGVCLAVLLVDGLDLQLLSFVAPVVRAEWGVDPAEFGIALSGALIGMAAGTAVGGMLGDRWGRRRTLLTSVVLFGAATGLAALSGGVAGLTVARIVAGFGFGAAMPNAYVLVTEVLPARARTRAVGLLSVGTPVGGLLGGALALGLLAQTGWRTVFVVCGLLSVVLVVAILLHVPESPAHRLARGDQAGAGRALARLVGTDRAAAHDLVPEERPDGGGPVSPGRVLGRENRRTTLGSWLGFFAAQFTAYAMIAWLPTVLSVLGLGLDAAIRAGIVYNACAVAGALLVSPVVRLLGTRWALVGAAAVAGVAVALAPLAVTPQGPALPVLLAVGAAGLGLGTVVAALYVVTPQAYPAAQRGTGLGLAVTWGRIAGIVTTLVGGVVLGTAAASAAGFFTMLVLACVAVVVAAFVLDRHVGRAAAR